MLITFDYIEHIGPGTRNESFLRESEETERSFLLNGWRGSFSSLPSEAEECQ